MTGELEEETRRRRIAVRGEGCTGQCPEEAVGEDVGEASENPWDLV